MFKIKSEVVDSGCQMLKEDLLQIKAEQKKATLDKHLKHFTKWVQIIYDLKASGEITDMDAYEQIKDLWRNLEFTKAQLEVDNNTSSFL
ncbi:hypothetical protein NIES2101_41730 [Calothrix sp. HK-06]|nr:hypothetical protein NIES2101_41730 [Calothrix sp. HK-06]